MLPEYSNFKNGLLTNPENVEDEHPFSDYICIIVLSKLIMNNAYVVTRPVSVLNELTVVVFLDHFFDLRICSGHQNLDQALFIRPGSLSVK